MGAGWPSTTPGLRQTADLYDEQRDGRVWCVQLKQVKNSDRLIFVQRAHRNALGVGHQGRTPSDSGQLPVESRADRPCE